MDTWLIRACTVKSACTDLFDGHGPDPWPSAHGALTGLRVWWPTKIPASGVRSQKLVVPSISSSESSRCRPVCSRGAVINKSRPPVSTVGAGDTFVAAVLYGMTRRAGEWDPWSVLRFAVALATRKVQQEGFDNMAANMEVMRNESLRQSSGR